MSKNKVIIISLIILMVLFISVPFGMIYATSGDDFVINEGVLTKYLGNDAEPKIPSGVNAIGPGAFQNSSITNITVPGTVSIIGEAAFYGCNNLTNVYIEDGVNKVANSAFADCEQLYFVSIPGSVKELGYGVFADDISLNSVLLGNGSPFFFNDGVIYNADSTEIIQYLSGNDSKVYEMPFSVKKINKYAFWGAKDLEYIRVSNNVAVIPAYAFSGCSSLKTVFLPESIKRVDDYAFYNCSSLNNLMTENDKVEFSSTALVGADNANLSKGVDESFAQNYLNEDKEEESIDVTPKVQLSGAVGTIHHGEVTILDAINFDEDEQFENIDGEIGRAKTSDGEVNVFFNKDKPIGTITLDKAQDRAAQKEEARKKKELEEKLRREAEIEAFKEKLDSMRKNAFSNWKNK